QQFCELGSAVAPASVPVLFLVCLPDRVCVRRSRVRGFDALLFLLNRQNLNVWRPKLRQTLRSLTRRFAPRHSRSPNRDKMLLQRQPYLGRALRHQHAVLILHLEVDRNDTMVAARALFLPGDPAGQESRVTDEGGPDITGVAMGHEAEFAA